MIHDLKLEVMINMGGGKNPKKSGRSQKLKIRISNLGGGAAVKSTQESEFSYFKQESKIPELRFALLKTVQVHCSSLIS